jgi:halimadienyl-diphosphate synthase
MSPYNKGYIDIALRYHNLSMVAARSVDTDAILANVQDILSKLGGRYSHSDSVAYDTAWVARLSNDYPGYGFDEAVEWLRRHQHQDGSWGGEILHFHDRIVSTLSALIALKTVGDKVEDAVRISAGESFLWHENGRLLHDANDTSGFPVLALALVNEATSVGLDVPSDLYRNATKIEKKLNMLAPNPELWRLTPLIFSFEALRPYAPPDNTINFTEANDSVASSPSATAAFILSTKRDTSAAVSYLADVFHQQGDGGLPFKQPFDLFEAAWTLNHLRQSELIEADDPEVQRILQFLYESWSDETGISASKYFHVPDLDDTAVTYSLLRWGGFDVDYNVFKTYETDTHFRCYPGELDPSLSVNIRTLAALRMDNNAAPYGAWRDKILHFLRVNDINGYFWFDKWHISPYYLTATAVWSLQGIADDLLQRRIQWIQKTQRLDGGWGYYQASTTEETAYCLEALLYWDKHVERIDPLYLHAAAHYIMEHAHEKKRPPMWIAKSLYTSHFLVESAILGALMNYQRYLDDDY